MIFAFSVVTIVYNDVKNIKETMHSVINQNYKNIEYILIDGGSTDGTQEAILEHIASCASITKEEKDDTRLYLEATHKLYPTLTFKFLSEKDKGIYDAMNKGISLATKEWINFMNCGDRFYNLEVLEKVASENIQDYDVVYGDSKIVYLHEKISLIKKASTNLEKSLEYFGNNLIHQSFLFKTKQHKQNLYLCQKYKIASDYELIYRLFYQNLKFLKLNIIVSIFHTGGASDTQGFLRSKESLCIAKLYAKNKIRPFLCFIFSICKKTIKNYFPSHISKILLQLYKKL